ncbi:hypothetical protein GGI11_006025, partial [Coemansia sp. RSA 2049]
MFDEAYSHQDRAIRSPMAYMMFYFWTSPKKKSSTRSIGVDIRDIQSSIDYLYSDLDRVLGYVNEAKEGYEDVFSGVKKIFIHFRFLVRYYPEPGCVDNWGKNIKPIERCRIFDLFTANEDSNCVLQCARRIWPVDLESSDVTRHKEATEDCIAKLIDRAKGKVVILCPRPYVMSINSIYTYGDLVIDSISPIKHMIIGDPDMVYLLHWREHVGVMESLKEQRSNYKYTVFRPIAKYPKCERVTVCFDIECYFDPVLDDNTRHVPYLCCACFVYDSEPGNVMEFEGRDCVAQMVEWSAELANEFNHEHIELVAHNGGGYDFHYILSSMYDPSAVYDILIRNNHFISFKFKHMGVEFSVKDSLNFMLCSLNNAAKAFLDDEAKTDFPHHEVKSEMDLQRVFQEWMSVDTITNVNVEKERMLITSEHIINYNENGEYKKLIDWAREYCCNDVIVLAKVWSKFKRTVADIFSCHIVEQTYTLAGLSFRLFEANLPANKYLHHPTRLDFDNMRASLIGGRCVSANGMYKNTICLDVKSLYPAAMAFYDQPYGQFHKVRRRMGVGELGIYYVQVTPYGLLDEEAARKAINTFGFFPLRSQSGEVSYSSSTTEYQYSYKAWYTSVDLDIGEAEGHKITYIPFVSDFVGYSWKHRGKIFKEYIQGVLYKLKLQYEEAGDQEKRQVIKIIMNSLWGKFAQKWMDTNYKIAREEDADLELECYKIWDSDHMLMLTHNKRTHSSKPVQNGVFVLSWARWHMKLLWDKIAKPQAKMLYSDTDSIIVKSNDVCLNTNFILDGKEMSVIGTNVGQLELEYEFDEVICVGKKQYIGKFYQNGRPLYKKRFKGVPQMYIRPEMYTHLLKSPNNTVQVEFLKFCREWGAVHGYIESKV